MAGPETENHEDWKHWVNEHSEKLLLFARQQTSTIEDAEDVLQESLVKIWQEAVARKPACGDLRNLAYTIVRRTAINLARSHHRRARREHSAYKDQEAWFETDPGRMDFASHIQAHLDVMDQKYRDVIVLRIWSELTFSEIATILNTNINSVASLYRYGLQKLKESIDSQSHHPTTQNHLNYSNESE